MDEPNGDTITYPDEMLQMLQPGTTVRVFYNENNPDNEIRHIRAVVDRQKIVYRVWSETKCRWRYHIEDLYAFWLLYDKGHMTND